MSQKTERYLQELKIRLKNQLLVAMDKGADVARQLVPVRTGDLRSTIRVEENGGDAIEATLAVGGIEGSVTGNYVDYALFVERHTPYIAPAVEEIKNNLPADLQSALTASFR